MIKSILCTLDGSSSSTSALRVAVSLASLTNSSLYGLSVADSRRFMHVSASVSLAGSLTGQPALISLRQPEALMSEEDAIEKEQDLLRSEFENSCRNGTVSGTFIAKSGNPSDVITQFARSVDLLVMGNCGKHKNDQYVAQGETVSAVLHNTTRPVFVVPERANGSSAMVIAYDGSPASERALRMGAEFAKIIDINEVHLLTVVSDLKEASSIQQSALDYLVAYEVAVSPVIVEGKVESVIADYAVKVDPSVIVLGAYGSGVIREAVFGGTTEFVLHEVESSLLLTS